jgi:predicted ester cyclase
MLTLRTLAAAGVVAATLGVAGAIVETTGGQPATASAADQSESVEAVRAQLLALTGDDTAVQQHLKTFDTLDFDVFSNQEWDRLAESHAENVRVYWPDGHVTHGLARHTADLKQLFVYAPDTRIKQHPIKLGSKDLTAVTGVFQGTFTRPMPDGKGGFIAPTGKAFKFPMATVAIWKRGKIVEEHLYWDNQTFLKQVGLAT